MLESGTMTRGATGGPTNTSTAMTILYGWISMSAVFFLLVVVLCTICVVGAGLSEAFKGCIEGWKDFLKKCCQGACEVKCECVACWIFGMLMFVVVIVNLPAILGGSVLGLIVGIAMGTCIRACMKASKRRRQSARESEESDPILISVTNMDPSSQHQLENVSNLGGATIEGPVATSIVQKERRRRRKHRKARKTQKNRWSSVTFQKQLEVLGKKNPGHRLGCRCNSIELARKSGTSAVKMRCYSHEQFPSGDEPVPSGRTVSLKVNVLVGESVDGSEPGEDVRIRRVLCPARCGEKNMYGPHFFLAVENLIRPPRRKLSYFSNDVMQRRFPTLRRKILTVSVPGVCLEESTISLFIKLHDILNGQIEDCPHPCRMLLFVRKTEVSSLESTHARLKTCDLASYADTNQGVLIPIQSLKQIGSFTCELWLFRDDCHYAGGVPQGTLKRMHILPDDINPEFMGMNDGDLVSAKAVKVTGSNYNRFCEGRLESQRIPQDVDRVLRVYTEKKVRDVRLFFDPEVDEGVWACTQINVLLLADSPKLARVGNYIQQLKYAIGKGKTRLGISYRGTNMTADEVEGWKKAKRFLIPSFVSTSKRIGGCFSKTKNTLIVVDNRAFGDFSMDMTDHSKFSEEEEILFSCYNAFELIRVVPGGPSSNIERTVYLKVLANLRRSVTKEEEEGEVA